MGLVDPVVAIIISFALLVILLYKRVNLGITLNATAITLALLALEWTRIPVTIYEASTKPETISVVIATFGIMLLSQLYKETGIIAKLSGSISRLINNPKIVLGLVPAVIGLLPVAGGALMSAPLVDVEAEKLRLNPQRKAYVNLWFRHTIFPVYPLSPPIITTAMLAGVTIPLIILRQIPTVLVMIIVGYLIGFWNVKASGKEEKESENAGSNFKVFLLSFCPILATIVFAIALGATGMEPFKQGRDVVIAVFIGIAVLVAMSKMSLTIFAKPFKNWGIYGITLAAYGAFLLREVIISPEIRQVFSQIVANGSDSYSGTVLLITLPAVLGVLTGSPTSGVAISLPILCGSSPVAASTAALIYISAYLGYTIAPTHLCFTFTADYFKCQLGKVYKYVIPSFIPTFLTALLVYFLL